MSTGRTDEFRDEAVRIALTSGLSRRQVADDLGVGFSTLNKWVGPVTYLCRSDYSFRLLGVRRPGGFCPPKLNAFGAGYRSR
jgi:hypothetical protein